MLRKIKLYGKLAKFIGHRVLEADVATAAEAVRFLLANWPELEAHMSDQHYRVSVGTYDLDLEELHHPAGAAPISFVPVVAGAGAVGRIIAGIALIALASYCYQAGIAGCSIYFGRSSCAISCGLAASALHLAVSPSS
jgi:predicted phage tail protein